jgi:hypothetical protein
VVGAPTGAGALMRLADTLAGCAEGSEEEVELHAIVQRDQAYEAKRRPLGKERYA